MLDEITLFDVDSEPLLSSIRSKRHHDSMIITEGNCNHHQIIVPKIVEQGKNAFSQQTSYLKLLQDESESGNPVRQQVSFLTFSQKYDDYEFDSFIQICSDGNVLPCKKQHCQCLCYILLTILSIVLIFLFGFGIGQTFRRQSSKYLMIVLIYCR